MKGPKPVHVLERIARRSSITDNGCWVSDFPPNNVGYPCMGGGARYYEVSRLVHRVAYHELVGPLDEALVIDHLCGNKRCWCPQHLRQVPQGVNNEPGRLARAEAQRSQELCKRGHPLSGDNLYKHPVNGGRTCRTCRKDNETATRRAAGIPEKGSSTTCGNGHKYEGDSFYVYTSPNGKTSRICRICVVERNARKKEGRLILKHSKE